MTCIKTGANVYLYTHGASIHGDLFEVGDVYILAVNNREFCWNHAPTRANVKAYAFEECGSHAYAFLKEQCSDFNYEGWRIA